MQFVGTVSSISPDVVVNFGGIRMWAERGLIHIEDKTTGEYQVASVRTILERMKGIQDMLMNSRPSARQKGSHDQLDNLWFVENQTMLEQMLAVVKRAQAQGMPSDPSACRDLVRRRKTMVAVSGNAIM